MPKKKTSRNEAKDIIEKTFGIELEEDIRKFLYIVIDDEGKEKIKGVNIDSVAEYLINLYEFKTIYGSKSDYCLNFDGKIYKKDGRGLIKSETERLLSVYCRRNIVDEVFEKIKRLTKVEREDFENDDKNLIPLLNGVWNIADKKLIPYEAKYNFRFIIPVNYRPGEDCPEWIKFLNEVLYPEDIETAQEWFGFQLFREYFLKKALICVGDRDTGKTVFLNVLTAFVGELNKTGLSLQKISSGSDFTKLSLKDKLGNIYDDLSSKDLSDGGAFKVATGGGWISAEEKFGDYMQFKNFAKHTFAANKIPPVKDNDDLAYFSRWIIFLFDNVVDKKDVFLTKKLTSPKELSGILNWALEGLYRILENGEFSYKKTAEEIKIIMERSGCPLVAFSEDCLEKFEGEKITKEEMFVVYGVWCEKQKRPRGTKRQLGSNLYKYCKYIQPGRDDDRVWLNARIKQEWVRKIKELQNKQKTLNTDTSDTSKNIMRTFSEEDKTEYNNGIYKNEKSVGFVGNPPDTSDTYFEEPIKTIKISDKIPTAHELAAKLKQEATQQK